MCLIFPCMGLFAICITKLSTREVKQGQGMTDSRRKKSSDITLREANLRQT